MGKGYYLVAAFAAFLRSAHRFLVASPIRFLAAADIRLRFLGALASLDDCTLCTAPLDRAD
jgi:hypothetical protein